MAESINIRHALIIALSLHKDCRKSIAEIYKKHEQEYYQIYKQSGFYTDCLKEMFSIETQETMNKLIGIIEKCYMDDSYSMIESLIKKVHPSILNFIKNSPSREVELDRFYEKYLKEDFSDLSELDIFIIQICLLYATVMLKQKSYKCSDGSMNTVLGYWNKLIEASGIYNNRFNLASADKEMVQKHYPLLRLQPHQVIKETTIGTFFDNMIDNEVIDRAKTKFALDTADAISFNDYQDIRHSLFKEEGIYKYLGAFSSWFAYLGIDQMDAESYVLMNNDVINMVFQEYERAHQYNLVEESHKVVYVVACLNMYILAELYHQAKDLYLNKSQKEKYDKLQEYEKKLEEKAQSLTNEETKYKTQMNKAKDEIDRLQRQIKELTKENNKLSAENIKNKDIITEQTEIISELKNTNMVLKDMINQFEDSMTESEITISEIVEEIKDLQIGICGGMKGISRLSNYLPNVVYFDSLNKDITAIKNMDYVFINTDFFKHGFTYKVDKYNIEYGYIGGTNIDIIIRQIYNYIKR